MKKLFLFPALLLAAMCLKAQTNVVFFSENGEPFWVIMNGIRQNQDPQTNIKIAGIPSNYYSIKVIFKDTANGIINDKIGPQDGNEITYVVKRRKEVLVPKNGGKPEKFAIKRLSMIPIAQVPPPPPTSTVQTITYTTTPPPPPTGVNTGMYTGDASFGVNVNVSGTGANISMNGAPPPPGSGTNVSINMNGSAPPPPDAGIVTTTTTTTTTTGCVNPMADNDFLSAKQNIESKTFEDTKLTLAKQIIGANCMTADQITAIASMFTYDDTKLKFAKYAYTHCVDKANYFKVNSVFQFESNGTDLSKYVEAQPR